MSLTDGLSIHWGKAFIYFTSNDGYCNDFSTKRTLITSIHNLILYRKLRAINVLRTTVTLI
jgi:hypothetical protein